jgi:hypothetical protein
MSQNNQNPVDYEYVELLPTANGEIVIAIARGVGILVAIVAILMWFMIMMMMRAIIAFVVQTLGVSGVILLVTIFVGWVMKYGNVSFKLIWAVLSRSCS